MMKNSLFANSLMVLIGILMLIAALQLFGLGKGTAALEPEGFDIKSLSQLELHGENSSPAESDQLVEQITLAPLFNLDRQPYVGETGVIDEPKDPPVVAEPLKAQVTSIIMIGDKKYAMVIDQISKEKVTLEPGMPLPGEQGLWVVDQIEPRLVTFVSEGEEPVSLELEVFEGVLNKNAANKNNNNKKSNKRNNKDGDKKPLDKKNSAEEIRRKIAERRAQMRANAAKKGNNK
jgi:hypothetical protein